MGRHDTRFLGGLLLAALAAALLAVPVTGAAQKGKGKGKKAEAAAATQPAAPADDSTAKAKEHYMAGKSLYEKGNYADAMAEFQQAYDLKPNPEVYKSIGECKLQMGDLRGAIEVFEKYVADPAAKKAGEVRAKIDELKGMMAQVEITSEPAGAGIMVDGSVTEKVTPATIELNPGEHQVVLNAEGYQPLEKPITLGKGEKAKMAVDFAKEGTATAAAAEPALVDPFAEEGGGATPPTEGGEIENEAEGPPAAFWIAAAVAGVGLVSGTVFGTMALGDEDDFNQKKSSNPEAKTDLDNIKASGERNAIIADVSFGVAAAAAIVGVIILFTDKGDEKLEAGASTSARVNVVPVATGEAIGLSTAVSF